MITKQAFADALAMVSQFETPGRLRNDAAAMERDAKGLRDIGMTSAAEDLEGLALATRVKADTIAAQNGGAK